MSISYNSVSKTNIYLNAVKKNFVYKDASKVYQSYVSNYFQYGNATAPAFTAFNNGGYSQYESGCLKIGWPSTTAWTYKYACIAFNPAVDLTDVKTIRCNVGNIHYTAAYPNFDGAIRICRPMPTSLDTAMSYTVRKRDLVIPVALATENIETFDIDVTDLTGIYYIAFNYSGPGGEKPGVWGYANLYSIYLIAND